MPPASSKDVDAYIATFPKDVQRILKTVRRTVRAAAPEAEETMSYRIPAYRFHGWLVYFAAFKNHYSVFGASDRFVDQFKEDLTDYEVGKGTIRFPFDQPVPVALIKKIVRFRASENLAREKQRKPRSTQTPDSGRRRTRKVVGRKGEAPPR